VWISPKAEKLLFVRAHTKQARGILVVMKEEEEDKEEEEEEEKEQQRRKKKEISLLLSKCRSLLERARRTVAEARIGFFTHHPGNNFVGNENENENENEDVNDVRREEEEERCNDDGEFRANARGVLCDGRRNREESFSIRKQQQERDQNRPRV